MLLHPLGETIWHLVEMPAVLVLMPDWLGSRTLIAIALQDMPLDNLLAFRRCFFVRDASPRSRGSGAEFL